MNKLEKLIYDAKLSVPDVNIHGFPASTDDITEIKAIAQAVLPLIKNAWFDGTEAGRKDITPKELGELAIKYFEEITGTSSEPLTGPVVGIEDDTPFNNAR